MTQLEEIVRGAIMPQAKTGVVAWAESQLYLSERVSANMPGPFSTLATPYMREVLECFADPHVSDLTLCWGSQNGKTLSMLIGLLWRTYFAPAPSLWVMPTEAMARSFSQSRLQPIIDDNAVLAALKPRDPDLYKLLEMHLARCTIALVGSNSPSNLASRPIATLVCDEVDKFASASNKETSALKLAEQRTKAFPGSALRVKTSTPTVPDADIWREFLRGDQRYFFLPCPHCGEKHPLEFSRNTLVWSDDARDEHGMWISDQVRKTARYICPSCQGEITDLHKPRMLRGGEWRPTNPAAERHVRSYHLNSLYSPWVSFGEIAVRFIEGQDLFGLQDFTNGYLALPWEEHELNLKDATLQACEANYERKVCPLEDPVMLTICADVHAVHTNYSVEAWDDDGTSYVVDWGEVLSPEDLLEKTKELVYLTPGGREVRPQRGLIDSGYATERVYSVCYKSRGFFSPAKGSTASDGKPWGRTALPTYRGMLLITYLDYAAKTELYDYRIDKRRAPMWYLPKNTDREFIKQHSNQRLVRKTGGRGGFEWKKVKDDHYGDCSKLHRVLWWAMNEGLQK